MAEPIIEPTIEMTEASKKRKLDVPLSDLKRQQLENARQKKAQRAAEKAQEITDLKSKLSEFESKLKETEQKVTNVEMDKNVQTEMTEKKAKIVVEESVASRPNPTILENFLNPENLMRTGLLGLTAGFSYYFKNVWRQPAPPVPVRPKPQEIRQLPQHRPISSLFKN